MKLSLGLILITIYSVLDLATTQLARDAHQPKQLTNRQIKTLASLTNLDDLRKQFKNIAVERVVGTENHEEVRRYIVNTLENLGWQVEIHSFESNTPVGRKTFHNIIAKLSPVAKRYLVVAAHYDSLMMPGFIGATDSAVPCAMMLNLAQVMDSLLSANKSSRDLSLKLVFFDGEEAFNSWSDTDSIYGAKALATKYAKFDQEEQSTTLDKWDLLVLLDLLGSPQPKFYNYIPSGGNWYLELVSAERKLAEQKLLVSYSAEYFRPQSRNHYVEDDHLPFMRRGVPVVHVIPHPFPRVWHKLSDNLDAIDIATVENLNKIIRVFVAKYLQLNV